MILAQISDLHVTAPGTKLLGRVDTTGLLRRCVARLGALSPRPDAVIATGDLVDQGTAVEYRALRELLAPLEMPVHLLLGNHDDRAAFRAAFGDEAYLRAIGNHVQYAFDLGELRVIALDTNDPGRPGGRLDAERRAWLEGELVAARDRPIVIAMHHPPFATGIASMDACGLDAGDTAALEALLAPHANIERVICGHLHRPIQARFAGTIAATAPSCAHQLVLALEPAAAEFAFEPPAFVQHAWLDGRLVSHQTYIDAYDGPYPF